VVMAAPVIDPQQVLTVRLNRHFAGPLPHLLMPSLCCSSCSEVMPRYTRAFSSTSPEANTPRTQCGLQARVEDVRIISRAPRRDVYGQGRATTLASRNERPRLEAAYHTGSGSDRRPSSPAHRLFVSLSSALSFAQLNAVAIRRHAQWRSFAEA
jgi:hypothetical protein